MQLIQAFNAQQFDPTQGVGSLPIGKHPVIVESSEVKANKNNDGGYLQLNLRIIDGPQQGTTGAYRLNLYHANQQTVEIAHRQLSAICHVVGVYMVSDSSQLHNLPFLIEVGPQKNDPTYTEVKKVFDMNGNEPGKAGQGAPAAQPQAQQPAGFGQQQQQPQGQQPAWGAQAPAAAPQQPQPGQTPAWGGQAPAQQQQPTAAPAAGPAWGGGQQQQPAAAPAAGPAWGGGQQQQPAAAGPAPWGQR